MHKISAENKVKTDKSTTSEKPRQLYWEKRLSGLRPSYPHDSFEPFALPKNFKPIGPGVIDDIVLASITTSLHMNSGAIVGQKSAKVNIIKTGKNQHDLVAREAKIIRAVTPRKCILC